MRFDIKAPCSRRLACRAIMGLGSDPSEHKKSAIAPERSRTLHRSDVGDKVGRFCRGAATGIASGPFARKPCRRPQMTQTRAPGRAERRHPGDGGRHAPAGDHGWRHSGESQPLSHPVPMPTNHGSHEWLGRGAPAVPCGRRPRGPLRRTQVARRRENQKTLRRSSRINLAKSRGERESSATRLKKLALFHHIDAGGSCIAPTNSALALRDPMTSSRSTKLFCVLIEILILPCHSY